MPLDLALLKDTLAVLQAAAGQPLVQDVVATDVECRRNRLVTTQQLESVLSFALDRGWVDWRKDDFGRKAWWLTDAGAAKLRSL